MNIYQEYAEILDGEALRHQRLSDLAAEPVIRDAHQDIMLALWLASELMRREAKRKWRRSCPRSATKRRLRLMPLQPGFPGNTASVSLAPSFTSTRKDDFTSLR